MYYFGVYVNGALTLLTQLSTICIVEFIQRFSCTSSLHFQFRLFCSLVNKNGK